MVINACVKIFAVIGIPHRVDFSGSFKLNIVYFNMFDLVYKDTRFTYINLGGGMVVTGNDVIIVFRKFASVDLPHRSQMIYIDLSD